MSATDDLIKQILASSNTAKWTGEGKGSAQANAADMAKLLSDIGITDIKQFGKITKEIPSSVIGYTENGEPIESGAQTITTFGNKVTGQEVPNTYGERQSGDFFGGTYTGKGNTGYGAKIDAQGNPIFYTQGASSNDLVNIIGNDPILGAAANIAAGYLGGPAGVAALQALMGKDIKDIAKSTALSYLGGQAGNYVSGSSSLTDILGKAGTEAVAGAAKQYVASGGKADPVQLLIGAGLNYGVNAAGEQLGFKDLPVAQQRMLTTALNGVVTKQPLDKLLMNVAMTGAMTKDSNLSNIGPGTAKEFSEGLIPGYFLPGGEGYTGKEVTNPLGPTEEFDPSKIDWAAMYADTSDGSPAGVDVSKYTNQEMQIDPNNWQEYNDRLIDIVNNKGGYTSQWQTVGGDRIMVQDDGTAIATNENGDSYSLNEDEVNSMVKNGILNTAASGYVAATGGTGNTPGGSGKIPTTKTSPPTSSDGSLASMIAAMNGQQQTIQVPSQDPLAHIKLMKDLFGTDIDLTPTDSSDDGPSQKSNRSEQDNETTNEDVE